MDLERAEEHVASAWRVEAGEQRFGRDAECEAAQDNTKGKQNAASGCRPKTKAVPGHSIELFANLGLHVILLCR